MRISSPMTRYFRAVVVSLATVTALVTHAQTNDARAFQQRQQQEQARQQQQEQMRRQQDEMRRQMQEQMRQQMRQQQQEQMRQQMRQQQQEQMRQQQAQARDQMAQQRREQQRQQQQELKLQQRDEQRKQMAAEARKQAQDQQKQLQRNQAAQANRQGTWQAGQGTSASDRRSFSNGVAKLNRPPTPAEAKRGFTGKVTADGKALVKFQGRVFAVPAARVGIKVPRTETSSAALATSWSPQKQASISGAIQKLASGGGISATFNSASTREGSPKTMSLSRDTWGRMDAAIKTKKFADVLRIEKGQRPDPKTYMSTEMLEAHTNEAKTGVSKILSSKPAGSIGGEKGVFVLLRQDADRIIRDTGGDPRKMEERLGLESGDLGNSPYKIDINEPKGLRVPSGNEPGANERWVPGGRTSGGMWEGVVDKIDQNGYTSTPIKKF